MGWEAFGDMLLAAPHDVEELATLGRRNGVSEHSAMTPAAITPVQLAAFTHTYTHTALIVLCAESLPQPLALFITQQSTLTSLQLPSWSHAAYNTAPLPLLCPRYSCCCCCCAGSCVPTMAPAVRCMLLMWCWHPTARCCLQMHGLVWASVWLEQCWCLMKHTTCWTPSTAHMLQQ